MLGITTVTKTLMELSLQLTLQDGQMLKEEVKQIHTHAIAACEIHDEGNKQDAIMESHGMACSRQD